MKTPRNPYDANRFRFRVVIFELSKIPRNVVSGMTSTEARQKWIKQAMNRLHPLNSDERNRNILLAYVKDKLGLFAEYHLRKGAVRFRSIDGWNTVSGEVYVARVDCFGSERERLLQKAFDELIAAPFLHGTFRVCPLDQYKPREPRGQDEIPREQEQQEEDGLNNCFFKTESTITHDELRFRSPAEVAIYTELKKRELLFFPNAAAVLGGTGEKREPDFLICHKGKWGILEVMGESYHTAVNAVKDHDRARLFKQHRLLCIEFYPAARCEKEPSVVVDSFLTVLASH
jgi:hypothetical protein